MPHILNRFERDRFIAILSRLQSDFEGERQAAALAAVRFLQARDLTWHQVIACPSHAAGWRATVTACLRQAADLSPWEHRFLRDLQHLHRLSTKQEACLARIADNVLGRRAA
jgi:hypothetical protein